MSSKMVLAEDEAPEIQAVQAFRATAARTQFDEPPDYAPMRLLNGAERLASFIKGRVSRDKRQLKDSSLYDVPHGLRRSNFDHYVARLDESCRTAAQDLVERNRLGLSMP